MHIETLAQLAIDPRIVARISQRLRPVVAKHPGDQRNIVQLKPEVPFGIVSSLADHDAYQLIARSVVQDQEIDIAGNHVIAQQHDMFECLANVAVRACHRSTAQGVLVNHRDDAGGRRDQSLMSMYRKLSSFL